MPVTRLNSGSPNPRSQLPPTRVGQKIDDGGPLRRRMHTATPGPCWDTIQGGVPKVPPANSSGGIRGSTPGACRVAVLGPGAHSAPVLENWPYKVSVTSPFFVQWCEQAVYEIVGGNTGPFWRTGGWGCTVWGIGLPMSTEKTAKSQPNVAKNGGGGSWAVGPTRLARALSTKQRAALSVHVVG